LEVDYRQPGVLRECVMDALLGAAWLESLGKRRIVLVGHSFGGAVVVVSGALSEAVVAVAALSSQSAGTDAVDALAPRPVIFIHGQDDEVLPARCSLDLYARAGEPKEILLYPAADTGSTSAARRWTAISAAGCAACWRVRPRLEARPGNRASPLLLSPPKAAGRRRERKR
jgi:dienelactone hydrolase